MPDREKVINHMETICNICKENTWRTEFSSDTIYPLLRDAIALLKEQTHGETFTVIDTRTGKEADEYNIALHEEWAKDLCYCDMEGWAIMDDGTLLLVDECGRFEYADRERFKVVWDV